MQKIKNNNLIIYVILGIYLYFTNIANYTKYSIISIIGVVLIACFYIVKNKKIYLNSYLWLYLLFV